MKVSRICLGTLTFGVPSSGPGYTEEESRPIIQGAVDLDQFLYIRRIPTRTAPAKRSWA